MSPKVLLLLYSLLCGRSRDDCFHLRNAIFWGFIWGLKQRGHAPLATPTPHNHAALLRLQKQSYPAQAREIDSEQPPQDRTSHPRQRERTGRTMLTPADMNTDYSVRYPWISRKLPSNYPGLAGILQHFPPVINTSETHSSLKTHFPSETKLYYILNKITMLREQIHNRYWVYVS